ncbi:unnamed protein product [Camellia sinensis]
MAQESISALQLVDEFYFSALFDENQDQIFSISDSKNAEELQFQEALMGSIMDSQMPNIVMPSTIQASPASTSPEPVEPTKEVGESSQSFCEICMERKEFDDMFRIHNFSHSYCFDCINKHVATKIQENMRVVKCPGWGCKGVLELNACRARMAVEVVAKWDELVWESMILETEKFHCPFKDCSAMLVDENGGEGIRECECPICHRLFCAECYVPWHGGIECEEF